MFINKKMPNLCLKEKGKYDVSQTASRFGFSSAEALVGCLLEYRPRKKLEMEIYTRLAEKVFANLPSAERMTAMRLEPLELGRIIRESRETAREIVNSEYALYDDVWSVRIRITQELLKHGSDVVSEINTLMPNLLTHDPLCSALDQIAMEYKQYFECGQDVVDWLLEYRPRAPKIESLTEKLARQSVGLPPEGEESELDEVPF